MASHRSAEEWIEAVNEIVRLYRGDPANSGSDTISREDALARMRELGVADGDAMRWLPWKECP